MACPCSVRMLSGWNCKPSTRRCCGMPLWRTPMISPSSVHAVMVSSLGPGGALNRQRVVAVHRELRRQPRKNAFLRGGDGAHLAMHLLLCPHDAPAQCSAQALVAQAHPQNRQLAQKVLDRPPPKCPLRLESKARGKSPICRDARAAMPSSVISSLRNTSTSGAQFTKVLDDVVGKAVVVVDHEQFHCSPSSTSSAARKSARALASVSFHSSSGTLSATTPAAACTYNMPFLMTPVRMAIATSMSPAYADVAAGARRKCRV